jgi:hypothetical protein
MHQRPALQRISLNDVAASHKWLGGREKREHFSPDSNPPAATARHPIRTDASAASLLEE